MELMTTRKAQVRVFIASSLDGFIAGPGDELDWLTEPRSAERPLAAGDWANAASRGLPYEAFMADVGAILMGRGTFDVVKEFPEPWPYGQVPLLVATSRPLPNARASVTAIAGTPHEMVAAALALAAGKDVYVDGGKVIRQCLDAGLIDELTVTIMPTVLGSGRPLFAGADRIQEFTVFDVAKHGDGMVQLRMSTKNATERAES